MTEEQLEVLMEYIDACIEDAMAREGDSEDSFRQASDFKYRMQTRLREVFIKSANRRLL